jgi:drug/metabolite transporter (DMT)-like permease
MLLFYAPIGLAILSTLLYHISQRLTPPGANPPIALVTTYVTAILLTLLMLLVFPLKSGVLEAFRQLNWASFGLALAIAGLEFGFLLAYRAGWEVSLSAIMVNVAASLLLIPIGLFFFREKLTPVNLLGILVCILGLVMVNWRK